jgi:hypothetical protein
MTTIKDAVLEHAKNYKGIGTSEGIELLGLEHSSENYTSANMYCAALSIIQKMQKEIKELENQLSYWESK